MIEPIGEDRQRLVIEATRQWIRRAEGIWQLELPMLPVLFDLRGRCAGMYRIRGRERVIRYNPWLFARYPEDNLAVTIPHEVAHYTVDRLHGHRRVRPHGIEWREVMRAFGVDARASVSQDLTGIPLRRQRRHAYRCACMVHQLTTRRHHRVIRDGARYVCRRCGSVLEPGSQAGRESSSSQRA